MAAPYERGQQVAYLAIGPEGMHVSRDEVEDVFEYGPDTWWVITTRGQGLVDAKGEGPNLLPLDEEMEAEFAGREEYVAEPVRATFWEQEVADRDRPGADRDPDDPRKPSSLREVEDTSEVVRRRAVPDQDRPPELKKPPDVSDRRSPEEMSEPFRLSRRDKELGAALNREPDKDEELPEPVHKSSRDPAIEPPDREQDQRDRDIDGPEIGGFDR